MYSQWASDAFGDLPDALINELLTRAPNIAGEVRSQVEKLTDRHKELREKALELGIIDRLPKDSSEIESCSVAAVDGSIASLRLSSFDLNAAAALVVEGFGKNERSDVQQYRFDLHIIDLHRYSRDMIYGLMFCMEYELAHEARQELVMLDGALSTGMLGISMGLRSAAQGSDDLSRALLERWVEKTREIVPQVLKSENVVAIPKRSSANEFATQTRLLKSRETDSNGRSIANLILKEGEFTKPFRLETHMFQFDDTAVRAAYLDELQLLYYDVKIIYFKPWEWSNALRIEFPGDSAIDTESLHRKLENIRRQIINPAMMEPYPLYVADRFAKSLSKGVSALLDAVRRDVIYESDDLDLSTNMLHFYRTDYSSYTDEGFDA